MKVLLAKFRVLGLWDIRYLYRILEPVKFKVTDKWVSNMVYLSITLYSKGINDAFDLLKISKLKEMWFG